MGMASIKHCNSLSPVLQKARQTKIRAITALATGILSQKRQPSPRQLGVVSQLRQAERQHRGAIYLTA